MLIENLRSNNSSALQASFNQSPHAYAARLASFSWAAICIITLGLYLIAQKVLPSYFSRQIRHLKVTSVDIELDGIFPISHLSLRELIEQARSKNESSAEFVLALDEHASFCETPEDLIDYYYTQLSKPDHNAIFFNPFNRAPITQLNVIKLNLEKNPYEVTCVKSLDTEDSKSICTYFYDLILKKCNSQIQQSDKLGLIPLLIAGVSNNQQAKQVLGIIGELKDILSNAQMHLFTLQLILKTKSKVALKGYLDQLKEEDLQFYVFAFHQIYPHINKQNDLLECFINHAKAFFPKYSQSLFNKMADDVKHLHIYPTQLEIYAQNNPITTQEEFSILRLMMSVNLTFEKNQALVEHIRQLMSLSNQIQNHIPSNEKEAFKLFCIQSKKNYINLALLAIESTLKILTESYMMLFEDNTIRIQDALNMWISESLIYFNEITNSKDLKERNMILENEKPVLEKKIKKLQQAIVDSLPYPENMPLSEQ